MRRQSVLIFALLLSSWSWTRPILASENQVEEQRYQQAVQLFNQKDFAGARKAFLEFQKAFPRSHWQLAVQLRLADLETDPARAEKAYLEVLQAGDRTEWAVDARWALANLLFSLGRYQDAAGHFLLIGQGSDPRRSRGLYLAGVCRLALKEYPAAKTLFTRVLEQFKESPAAGPALAGLADTELESGNDREALQLYDRYLKEYPGGNLTDQVKKQRGRALEVLGLAGEPGPASGTAAAAPAAPVARELPKGSPGDRFTVQVGAFSRPEYAAGLIKKLRAKGYNAYILDAKSGDGVLHQVRVGAYATHELALAIARQLEKKDKLPTLVLPYVPPDRKSPQKAEDSGPR